MIITNNSISLNYTNLYTETSNSIHFPIFQRGYTWKKEQTENILQDILTLAYEPESVRKTKQLYLLDFIWYEEDGFKKLADGQQRGVTLNILMLCINEYIENHNLSIPLLNLFDFSYDDEEIQAKYEKFFVDKKRTTAPFANVYKTMSKFVSDYNQYLESIVDVIKNNIFVYFKQANDVDDAFSVFTQINSGGKPLSKDDVIKTTVKQYSNKYGLPIDEYDFKDIKNLIKSYYKLTSGANSGNFNNLAIMSFLNKQIVSDRDAFKAFCNYMKMVKEINKHSIYYVINYIGKDQLLSVLYALGIQGIDVTAKREYLEKVLLPLSLMSIVWKIKKTNPGGVVLSLFSKVIDAIKNKKSVDDIQKIIINFVTENPDICKITLADFTNGLGADLERNTKKAILIMDVIKSNTSGYLNVSSINLEHIFPQKPADEWILKGWTGNADEQEELIDSIGNYILLAEAVNKKIQNEYITEKVIEYKKIIPMDIMLQTTLNTVDFNEFEKDKDKYIYKRQEEIAKHIQSDFFFGPMLII